MSCGDEFAPPWMAGPPANICARAISVVSSRLIQAGRGRGLSRTSRHRPGRVKISRRSVIAKVLRCRGVAGRSITSGGVLGGIEDLDLAAERLPHQRAGARAEFLTFVGDIALARHCWPIERDELLPGECSSLLQRRRRCAPRSRNIGRQCRVDIDRNLSGCETSCSEADGQSQGSKLERSLQRNNPPIFKLARYSGFKVRIRWQADADQRGKAELAALI